MLPKCVHCPDHSLNHFLNHLLPFPSTGPRFLLSSFPPSNYSIMYLRPPMLAFCLLGLVSVAASRACRTPDRANGKMQSGRAAYFITNDQANAIVALPIGSDGQLSEGTITSTRGSGMSSVNGMTNQPAAPDGLVSQSAVALAGNVSMLWVRSAFMA